MKNLIVITFLFLFDYLGKEYALKFLKDRKRKKIFKGKIQICYIENRGIAFNLLNNKKKFIVISNIVLMTYIAYLYLNVEDVKFPLLLIFIGGMGNLFDRLKRGYVIDYIYFNIKKWPIFNLSDFYVFIGAILLLIL
jgi:signal peptidase II